jgi:hypothetical protein
MRINLHAALVTALVCIAASAYAQTTNYSIRQIRDPVQFQLLINDDMLDIETRAAALESTIGTNAAAELVTVGAISVTGAVTIAEGKLADSTVVSADIKDGEIVNADVNASAAIAVTKLGTGGLIPANSAASLTNIPGANVTGDIPLASMTNSWGVVPVASIVVTGVIFNAGATTADWTFVNGLLTVQPE